MRNDLILKAATDFHGVVEVLLDEFRCFRPAIVGDLSDFAFLELRNLLEPLQHDRCPFADRLAAAYTLAAWGLLSEASERFLRHAMSMPGDPEFGAPAAAALARHGDASAIKTLKEMWRTEGTVFIAMTAVDVLCRIGDA